MIQNQNVRKLVRAIEEITKCETIVRYWPESGETSIRIVVLRGKCAFFNVWDTEPLDSAAVRLARLIHFEKLLPRTLQLHV
jgi:hypothetical protein